MKLLKLPRLRRRKLDPEQFKNDWKALQKLCASRDTWAQAVINADQLLDDALKIKRLKGKSMGERMVAAQRELSDNDAVWFAHNFAKKLLADAVPRLREADVKRSLVGFRRALQDLGAL